MDDHHFSSITKLKKKITGCEASSLWTFSADIVYAEEV